MWLWAPDVSWMSVLREVSTELLHLRWSRRRSMSPAPEKEPVSGARERERPADSTNDPTDNCTNVRLAA